MGFSGTDESGPFLVLVSDSDVSVYYSNSNLAHIPYTPAHIPYTPYIYTIQTAGVPVSSTYAT